MAAVGVALAAATAGAAGGAGFVLGSVAHDAGGHGDRHGFVHEWTGPDGFGANALSPGGAGPDAG